MTDDVSIAGLALKTHTFGVALIESVDFSDDSIPFDGLMGLAQSVRTQDTFSLPRNDLVLRHFLNNKL